MEFQKTINLSKKTSNDNDLLKKETITTTTKKTEIKIEKTIISFTINHDSIV